MAVFHKNHLKGIIIKQFCRCSSKFSQDELLDRFRGCLVGALIGDCYGKPYKLSEGVSKPQLQKYFDKLDGPYFQAPYKPYSPNTAFSICLAQSLLETKTFDAKDVTKRFAKEFFNNPHRDYGSNIPQILAKLRGTKFESPYRPASKSYHGMGSYGNSAAARVAPVSLFYKKEEDMIEFASKSASLTNNHRMGRNGAILQSLAVKVALEIGPKINTMEYLSKILQKVKQFEIDEEGLDLKDIHRYEKQLNIVEKLLEQKNPSGDQVVDLLGHAKVAVYSVPTAIYCFLRGSNNIDGVETENNFRRTVQYAISLGGDADSIASMAAAIAGACYGHSSISQSLQRHCEGIQIVDQLARDLATVEL